MSYKGIDVSLWNGTIDWSKVKAAGTQFAIVRCGYGNSISQKDKTADYNLTNARKNGILTGAYWFSYAYSESMAKQEADVCAQVLKNHKLDLPVYFDWEDDSLRYAKQHGVFPTKVRATGYALAFIKRMREHGYEAGLYSNINYLNLYFDISKFKSYPVWVACWGSSKPSVSPMTMWQNTDALYINGCTGRFDGNIGYFTIGKKSTTKTTTTKKTTTSVPDITYRVRTAEDGWLPAVKNLKTYAGARGHAITDIAIAASKGSVKYRAHICGGSWLPWVSGYNIKDANNGFAGDNKPIDALQIKYVNANGKTYKIRYRVSPVNASYYPTQVGTTKSTSMDGYAGVYGVKLDRVQIRLA